MVKKSKLKKFIVSFTVVMTVFIVFFSMLTYAATDYWQVSMPISQPNCTDTFTYVEVVTHNSDGSFGPSVFLISAVLPIGSNETPESPNIAVQISGNTITFRKSASSDYFYNILYVGGNGDLWDIGTISTNSTVSTSYSNPICACRCYGFAVDSGSTLVNNITNVAFIYGSDNVSINYLAAIMQILQNKNNDDIVGAINNQTQQQIEADKENTDNILSGWDKPDSPSDGSFNDYGSVEDDLIGSTQDNQTTASAEVNDSFLGSLQRNFSSMSAITKMFSDMLLSKMPDFGALVWFSLAMGVVPLIVGLSIQGLRAHDKAAARERRASERASRRKGG